MLGWFGSRRGWDLMSHGNAFAQFLLESGEFHRRSHQFGSINWVMGMASRPVYGGPITVRTMPSAEPWTIRGCGYRAEIVGKPAHDFHADQYAAMVFTVGKVEGDSRGRFPNDSG